MTQITNFGFLGKDFQFKLVSQIMCDRSFGVRIIPLILPNYFENQYCKQVVSIIKDYNEKHNNQLPTISGLKEQINAQIKDDIQRESCLEVLNDIKKRSLEDDEATKELAEKFCLQQSLVNSMKRVQNVIDRGDFIAYDEILPIFQDALSVTTKRDDSMEVDDDLDGALEEDFRQPYATGITGLDNEIGGGLAKEELGMLIIPTGVGKTTLLSKFANTAYQAGANVLQIFFEDKKKDIQRKHLSAYTNVPINELHKHKDLVKKASYLAKENGGKLILKKCPSLVTTVPHIVQYIRYLETVKKIKIDMLILDYIDCLGASKISEDSNANEGTIIRQLESLTAEFNIATWTAAQGNRCVFIDTLVISELRGEIKIKDLVLGEKILTEKGFKKVSHIFPIEKQCTYKIKTKSGKEIIVSAKHNFPISDGRLLSISTGLKKGQNLLIKK